MNYYNDNDPKSAAWLRELMAHGLIPNGHIDTRSIHDLTPDDLAHYTQVHLFAGIGGWPLALALAGWPEDRPVWTMSCPCQPFSAAGKRKGNKDKRHLWPVARALVRQCAPPVALGEQVASKDGRLWLAGVRSDLERMGYAVGAADLCAAGLGAPHIRQRLFWVADAHGRISWDRGLQPGGQYRQQPEDGGPGGMGDTESHYQRRDWLPGINRQGGALGGSSCARGMDDCGCDRRGPGRRDYAGHVGQQPDPAGGAGRLANPEHLPGCPERIEESRRREDAGPHDAAVREGSGRLGDASGTRLPPPELKTVCGKRRWEEGRAAVESSRTPMWMGYPDSRRCGQGDGQIQAGGAAPAPAWARCAVIPCRDGKARRIESGSFPLAHGVPGRVGLLRGYGNAIVPELAAEFILAFVEAATSGSMLSAPRS